MAKRTLYLDFQSDGITWILMRAGFGNATIEKSGRIVCRAEAVNDPAAATALRELRDSLDIPGLACLAAISTRGLLVRHIAVPFGDKRKVRQILPLELEATLPVAADELSLDFQMAGSGDDHAAITVAMPKAQIAAHLKLLREAGLDPLLMTFSGLPAAVLLAASPHGEDVSLLIDGDDRHCLFFIVGRRRIQFIRSWRPPASDPAPNGVLQTAIKQTVEAAAQVLPEAVKVHAIRLTPRCIRFYPLEHLASGECPVSILDLKASMPAALTGALPEDRGQGALALRLYEPLADKGFNLYRSTFPIKRFVLQHRNHLVRIGALAAVLTALFMTNVYLDIRRADKHTAVLEAEAEAILKQAFPETRNIVNPLQQMIVKLRETRSLEPASSSGPQVTQIDVLDTISKALPDSLDIHVTQLVSGAERVQLSGTTGTFEAVNEARELLEKATYFDKITIVSANMDQNAGRVRFKLAVDLIRRP